MRIGVIGANGKAGSLIVQEAVSRGHDVTSIIRQGQAAKGTVLLKKDLFDLTL
ncbi:hypothetical protein [Erysipelothrix larvae]|uniref:hypothetical protein n=1 Tax=Erysipelothrix larvae TaxID=1514105 RepID=UPI000AA0BB14|nr:hypothetical protein [Erysipelothrix larvae]